MKINIKETLKLIAMIIILAIVGNTISIAICTAGKLIVFFAIFLQTIFVNVGELFKKNILLFALWIVVLSKIRKIPLKILAYKSIIKLIDGKAECSICLEGSCDLLIE
jgi:hypothetical protein